VKQQVIGLARHLVDAVDVGRPQLMLLIDRQIARPAVDLARAVMRPRVPVTGGEGAAGRLCRTCGMGGRHRCPAGPARSECRAGAHQ